MTSALAGRTAVVTGASRGIGLAITRALATAGMLVHAGARTITPELAALDNVHPVAVDLGEPDGPATLVAAAGPRLDVLVNNVGSARPRPDGFAAITDEEWQQSVTLNLLAAVRTTRAALPALIAAGTSSVVMISSVNSTLADPMVIDYCATKAALSSFAKALAKELGPHGVRVNTISPGPVATDLWLGDNGVAQTIAAATAGDPKAVAAQAAAQMVTGRFTTPDEIAGAVMFLASEAAANMTGADIRIDGDLVPTWS